MNFDETSDRLAMALDATNSGMWDWNIMTGNVVSRDEWFQKCLGYEPHQTSPNVNFWKSLLHPDDLPNARKAYRQHVSGKTETYESINRLRTANGQWRWILDRGRIIEWTSEGKPLRMIGINTDITDRKYLEDALRTQTEELEAEVERRAGQIQNFEQQRMQIEKLATLARIAAGVAHEINNPLASISQAMVLIKNAIDPLHPDFEYVGQIEECIARMSRIVRHLFDLCRPQGSTLTKIDVLTPMKIALDIMKTTATKQNIIIKAQLPKEPVEVLAMKSELIQVICNLIQNSLDASIAGQTVWVRVTPHKTSVEISVIDKGYGISSTTKPHIFTPFFTTKNGQDEKGLGMGLPISRNLIEAMGGKIDFASTIPKGSTFTIALQKP